MRLSIAEILAKAGKEKKAADKVAILQENDSVPLRTILQYAYDPSIEFLVPDSEPPYKPSESFEGHGMLYSEARRLKIFVRGGGYDQLNQYRREVLFVEMLESVHADDAKVLVAMITERKFKGITDKTVKAAFPELINEI